MNYTQSEEYLFNTMPVGRAIASLAVPTVISQIITVIYNMADTFFVGQLGDPNQVAAATVALPLFIFITALANLFGVGGASLISRCLGQGDRQKAGHTAAFCIWSAIAVSLIYGIAVLLLRQVLLPLLGADAETFGYSSSYVLYSIGLGAMPAALNPMLAHLVRAEGHSRQAQPGGRLWRHPQYPAGPFLHLRAGSGNRWGGHRYPAFQSGRGRLLHAVPA